MTASYATLHKDTLLVTSAPSWFQARAWLAILLNRDAQGLVVDPHDPRQGRVPAGATAELCVPAPGAGDLPWLHRHGPRGLEAVASVEATLAALTVYPAAEESAALLRKLLPAPPQAAPAKGTSKKKRGA